MTALRSPKHPNVLYCRSIGTSCAASMRVSRGGSLRAICRPTLASRSTCTRTPQTINVVPNKSDPNIFRSTAVCGSTEAVRVATNGKSWRTACRADLLRERARAPWPSTARPCGIYLGRGGQVYVSPDWGESWSAIVRDLPAVLSVEVQTLP